MILPFSLLVSPIISRADLQQLRMREIPLVSCTFERRKKSHGAIRAKFQAEARNDLKRASLR
jgi:hypothetical protein